MKTIPHQNFVCCWAAKTRGNRCVLARLGRRGRLQMLEKTLKKKAKKSKKKAKTYLLNPKKETNVCCVRNVQILLIRQKKKINDTIITRESMRIFSGSNVRALWEQWTHARIQALVLFSQADWTCALSLQILLIPGIAGTWRKKTYRRKLRGKRKKTHARKFSASSSGQLFRM